MAVNRREFLGVGGLMLAGAALPIPGLAQGGVAALSTGRKLKLDAYSRTLHWLRTPQEVAQACHEIGNSTIDLTVRVYPGHVAPDKVKTDLPPFVNGLKREGITVTSMAAEITDANTPHVEEMLGTASSLGIRHHWWRGFRYEDNKPLQPQIDGFKKRTEGLVKLEEKYGTKAMYHPMGGFSGVFFDLLDMIKDFDPRYVSVQYDTGNLFQANQQNLVMQLRLGAPYIGGFVFKDIAVVKEQPGESAPAPRRSPANGARGEAGQNSRGRGGRGGPFRRPAVNGYRTEQVPVGTGMIDLPLIAQTLKEINFDGPMECQPEWPALDGPSQGLDKLSIPRETVINYLKRDYTTVTSVLNAAGLT
jgi:sugar phosphate isomerase/epimerase